MMWEKALRNTSHVAGDQGVDQQHAGDGVDQVLVGDIEPARPRRPSRAWRRRRSSPTSPSQNTGIE